MKIIIAIVFLSFVISFYSCSNKIVDTIIPEPKVETSIIGNPEDSIKVYDTKNPFALIEDKGFEALLITMDIDKDNQINGKVALEDIENLDSLQVSPDYVAKKYSKKHYEMIFKRYPKANFLNGQRIVAKNLKGIENFKNLKYLDCTFNLLDSLDLSKNTLLTDLIYNQTSLKYLNITECKNLKVLDLGPGLDWISFATPLKKIDISHNPELEEFRCSAYVQEINFIANTKLKVVDVRFCYYLKTLDLSHLKHLKSFLAINCSELQKVCLSAESVAKIDTNSLEYIGNYSRNIWQKDSWTVWDKCN